MFQFLNDMSNEGMAIVGRSILCTNEIVPKTSGSRFVTKPLFVRMGMTHAQMTSKCLVVNPRIN